MTSASIVTRQEAAAADVVSLRMSVQDALGVGITAAQDWCAAAVCSQRRAWQQWERGERSIHPGIYKLARMEVARLEAERGMLAMPEPKRG